MNFAASADGSRCLFSDAACHSPVLSQDEQAGRINVQPACRCQSLQAGRMEGRRVRHAILCFWSNQCHSRLAARFRLTRDITYRLVQQNRQPALLIRLRLPVEGDDGTWSRARPEFADLPSIHVNPATRNVFIGIAARTQASLGHQLGDAYAVRQHPTRRNRGSRGALCAGADLVLRFVPVRRAGGKGCRRFLPGRAAVWQGAAEGCRSACPWWQTGRPAWPVGHPQAMSSSSISNTSFAFGGINFPAPRAP